MSIPGERPAPILMKPGDVVGLKRAQTLVDRDAKTIRRWCTQFGIGFNACRGAEWEVSAPGLVMVRHNDLTALELLRAGQRNHPRVKRILDHLGISP